MVDFQPILQAAEARAGGAAALGARLTRPKSAADLLYFIDVDRIHRIDRTHGCGFDRS